MKWCHILAGSMIVLAACNNSDKTKKKGEDDNAAKPAVKKDVAPERILPDDGQLGVRKGAVFIYKNRGFELFSGGASMGKAYAETINRYSRLKVPGLKIFNLVIPNSFEFEVTERYKNLVKPATEAINNIFAAEDPDVIGVNPVMK